MVYPDTQVVFHPFRRVPGLDVSTAAQLFGDPSRLRYGALSDHIRGKESGKSWSCGYSPLCVKGKPRGAPIGRAALEACLSVTEFSVLNQNSVGLLRVPLGLHMGVS